MTPWHLLSSTGHTSRAKKFSMCRLLFKYICFDRASFYVEIGYPSGQIIDNAEILKEVDRDLKEVGFVKHDAKIIAYEFVDMDPAYVHINKRSEEFKKEIARISER